MVPNAQTHYKVAGDRMFLGGICRAPDCTLDEHEHAEAQLTLLFAGTAPTLVMHDEVGRTTQTAIWTDSFIFVAPDQPHRLQWKDHGEVLHLWMAESDLRELAEETKCAFPRSRLGEHTDPGIYAIGRILMDEFDSTGGLTPSMLHHATSLMLGRMLRVEERLSRQTITGLLSRQRLLPAVHFISDCPEQEFTLVKLAAMCNASVFHFARSFTERMGCAPFAFQRQMRIQKSQRLLLSTEFSVEAIGLAVGFANATHFSRMFRRHTGLSPRQYRNQYSAG